VSSYYVLSESRYGLSRAVLNASPILAVLGALVLYWSGRQLGKLFKLVVVVGLVVVTLLGSGLIPHLVGMDEYTGIFLSPGDKLYERRFITSEHADALSTLTDRVQRVFFHTPYEHEACVSQSLIHPYKFISDYYKYKILDDYGVIHYFIISSDRLPNENEVNIDPWDKLIIDIPGLKVWEAYYKKEITE